MEILPWKENEMDKCRDPEYKGIHLGKYKYLYFSQEMITELWSTQAAAAVRHCQIQIIELHQRAAAFKRISGSEGSSLGTENIPALQHPCSGFFSI